MKKPFLSVLVSLLASALAVAQDADVRRARRVPPMPVDPSIEFSGKLDDAGRLLARTAGDYDASLVSMILSFDARQSPAAYPLPPLLLDFAVVATFWDAGGGSDHTWSLGRVPDMDIYGQAVLFTGQGIVASSVRLVPRI